MDKSFQTSFIPKKPLTVNGNYSEDNSLSIFSFVAMFLFAASMLSLGGVFLYKVYLSKQKSEAEKTLISIKNDFEPNTIKELELFDKRTNASKLVLANHTVMSPFFDTLSKSTITAIQYTKFSIDMGEKDIVVNMSGVTRNYKYIALQSQIFNNSSNVFFKNVVFSNLVKDKNNKITFNVSFSVSPSLFSYSVYGSTLDSKPKESMVTPGTDITENSTNADVKDNQIKINIPVDQSKKDSKDLTPKP